MSAPEFPLPVSDLDAAGKPFQFVVRNSWLRGALEGHEAAPCAADGHLEIRASKSGGDVVVHGILGASLSLPCARCLRPFEHTIRSSVSVLYVPASKLHHGPGAEHEFTEAEADMLPYAGETIELDDLVRDEIILEVPMIPLCSEDCPGMSPTPGIGGGDAGDQPKAPDPRLAPLLQFRSRATKS